MALAGPRLDRPSVIGDEGRPRATSLAVASLIVLAIVTLVGWRLGEPTLALGLGSLIGIAVAGVGLLRRTGFVALVAANLIIVTFGSAAILVVVLLPFLMPGGLAVSGCALALLGIGLTWADAGSEQSLGRLVAAGGVTYVTIALLVPIGMLLMGIAIAVPAVLEWVAATGSSMIAVLTFLVVGAVASALVGLSVHLLPFSTLAPTAARDSVAAAETAIVRAGQWLSVGAVATIVLAVLGTMVLGLTLRVSTEVILPAGLGLVAHPDVIYTLLWIAGFALITAMLATGARLLTSEGDSTSRRLRSGVAVGVGLVVLLPIWTISLLLEPAVVLLFGIAVGLGTPLLILLGVLLLMGQWGNVVPDRIGGPTIAAGGLLVTAIGLGSAVPLLVFACVAGAAVVWGICWNGLAITAELGHLPATRRIELIHGVATIGVGLLAVALAGGALVLLRTLPPQSGGLGLSIAAVGTLLVLAAIRE